MKFTEGYWLRSERYKANYASCAYSVTKIDGGMRILAPCKKIETREDTLNMPTLTIEFTSTAHNTISVLSYHHEAYESNEARYKKHITPQSVEVTVNNDEAVMIAGDVTVRVDLKTWGYRFEADGKVITSCGFRNLGYMQKDKQISTMFPESNYLSDVSKPYMVNELSIQPGETVYGLGERFTAFVKNGQAVETWNEDGGTSSQIAYKCIPFYMTNKGYGIFVDHTDNVSFEVASEKVEYVGFSVPGEVLRYEFIYGPSPKEIIRSYTSLTGKPALPPAWSYGLWLSTSFTTDYDETTTSSFIDGMIERDIPLSVFHFDCFWMKEFSWCNFEWDDRVFPDVPQMLRRYKEKDLKIDLWINPYIAQGSAFFKEGVKKGYFLKRKDGKGVKQVDWWQTGMALVDFTNPEASKWYTDKLKTLLDIGVDCFKTDFGERIPIDVVYHDGSDPVTMHNYYTFIYNEAVFNLLKEVKGENEAVLFARSATAGSQQFPVHWGGDCSANYPSMAETLRGGLSFAMSGFAFWSHDISGFESTATPDLYKRWTAFGLLSTHSRLHGSTSYRVPWLFDDESSKVVKHFTNLKCRLMPYIYAMSILARDEGTPVMRPMVFEYPMDMATQYLDMQYMLGDSLLVAPIFNDEGKGDYYLPDGLWTDYFTDEVKEGGRWYHDVYNYFTLPLYVKPNTLLAIGSDDTRPDYNYSEGVSFHLYQLSDGETCEVQLPTIDGEIDAIVVISRIDGCLVISMSKLLNTSKIILHGIHEVQSVQNATVKTGEFGIELLPIDVAVEVII